MEIWFKNGLYHRADGPAMISRLYRGTSFGADFGPKRWYFNGKEMEPMELFEMLTDEEKEKAIWNLDQWK